MVLHTTFTEFYRGLTTGFCGVSQCNKLLYNNISRVRDASATDGIHVCVHGRSPGPDGVGCRNLSWGVYLDGGGYHGLEAHGNVIDATLQGGFFANGAGVRW